jgi:uncharacterized protein (TIGR02145 family)
MKNLIISSGVILLFFIIQSCQKEELPALTTSPIARIAKTSAYCYGTIINEGSDSLTDKGFCWSTGMTPTLKDNKITSINPSDVELESPITGLLPNTSYYVRAYAINEAGIAYGNQVSLVTKSATSSILFNPDVTYGSVSDIEGNRYKTVEIGTQVWLAENLKTTKFNDGTPIPLIINKFPWTGNTPGYGWYENNEAIFKNIYGAYYNWDAVSTGKLCPTGWHVPSDEEWKILEMFLGMSREQTEIVTVWRGSTEGSKIKETGTINWVQESATGTNESGFTGLPGGVCYVSIAGASQYRNYLGEGISGVWWTTTELYSPYDLVWLRGINYDSSMINRFENTKASGLNVRCIKD